MKLISSAIVLLAVLCSTNVASAQKHKPVCTTQYVLGGSYTTCR